MPGELKGSLELRKGRHSVVYLTEKYAIKQFHEKFLFNFLKEVKFLTLLQPFFFTPELYFIDFERRRIVMERLKGKKFEEVIDRFTVKRVLEACFILDSIGIEKQEMNHPNKHIIVTDDIHFVDFERSRFKERPSNLTQFCMYLKKFGIIVRKEFLKKYKASVGHESFEEVLMNVLENFD